MAQIDTQPEIQIPPSECIFQSIVGFMLPFLLAGAGGDLDLAHAASVELIDAYDATTLRELDLVGSIINFGLAAMDDLRRSMSDPDMPDAKVLRYRSNAVALSRNAERCRQTLEVMQAERHRMSKPADVPPVALVPVAVQAPTQPATAPQERPVVVQPSANGATRVTVADIERMKLDARAVMHSLQRRAEALAGATPSASAARPGFAWDGVDVDGGGSSAVATA